MYDISVSVIQFQNDINSKEETRKSMNVTLEDNFKQEDWKLYYENTEVKVQQQLIQDNFVYKQWLIPWIEY